METAVDPWDQRNGGAVDPELGPCSALQSSAGRGPSLSMDPKCPLLRR